MTKYPFRNIYFTFFYKRGYPHNNLPISAASTIIQEVALRQGVKYSHGLNIRLLSLTQIGFLDYCLYLYQEI